MNSAVTVRTHLKQIKQTRSNNVYKAKQRSNQRRMDAEIEHEEEIFIEDDGQDGELRVYDNKTTCVCDHDQTTVCILQRMFISGMWHVFLIIFCNISLPVGRPSKRCQDCPFCAEQRQLKKKTRKEIELVEKIGLLCISTKPLDTNYCRVWTSRAYDYRLQHLGRS